MGSLVCPSLKGNVVGAGSGDGGKDNLATVHQLPFGNAVCDPPNFCVAPSMPSLHSQSTCKQTKPTPWAFQSAYLISLHYKKRSLWPRSLTPAKGGK